MTKKLVANADHYSIKTLRMAYMNSHVDGDAYKHLVARSRMKARKPFTTAEKMFKVLQKAYKNSNRAHTAANKFRDLKMTGDFNNFWAKFQVLVSELDHSEATFIGKLKYKLTLLLSQAMAGGVSWPKDIQAFLGFLNFYRQFVEQFSQQTRLLIKFTKKEQYSTRLGKKWVKYHLFEWIKACQKAFEDLKHAFTAASVLAHYNAGLEMWIETDSSNFVTARVLLQMHNGVLRPVAFFLKKMSLAECNYMIYDKKLLVIIKSFET